MKGNVTDLTKKKGSVLELQGWTMQNSRRTGMNVGDYILFRNSTPFTDLLAVLNHNQNGTINDSAFSKTCLMTLL